ncbi:SRPBCC family protein [filamentous cyanobacterium LEGE 11480]|uniref:SRPBCC family protein n=1 Tax=Romeriopsis navalis LEGE 11480 TaxID=2777977 RepID=A0A928VQY5_9CYAN|nr:SRPBCC family protein [Romeriopsis navalis]MBE9030509.1 SRPBCC family protein [Romeriopsis navalis LEGE 11480]
MWTHHYQQQTDLSPEALWSVLADVSGWAEIDENIETISVDGVPAKNSTFMLKPKGGPRLHFQICDFEPPVTYADICEMPFATMKTTHRLIKGDATTIDIQIVIEGMFAPIWGVLVGRKHANGLPAQTQRFIAAARSLQPN